MISTLKASLLSETTLLGGLWREDHPDIDLTQDLTQDRAALVCE